MFEFFGGRGSAKNVSETERAYNVILVPVRTSFGLHCRG